MTVVVFRSRLDEAHIAEFTPVANRMLELAQMMPGFLSYKAFNSDDGERVSIIEFETSENAAQWGRQAEHLKAQQAGRDRFYTEFDLKVCDVVRESRFER